MQISCHLGVALLGFLIAGAVTDTASAAAPKSAEKGPPACAALAFRPVPSGATDGDQDAGLYKSRFGRIVVKATVKSGEPQDYFAEVDGKPPAPVKGALPASVASCAATKKLPSPGKPSESCTGDGLKVLIDHSAKERYLLLYVRSGGQWRFCRAGTI